MFSTVALLGIAALLARFGAPRLSLHDALSAPPAPRAPRTGPQRQPLPASFAGAAVLVAIAAVAQIALPTRVEQVPARAALVDFPTRLGEWQGEREPLAGVYAEALKLDDYLLANYRDATGQPLNFYVAWYDSQRAGRSVHSPRACLPGGGWIIRSFEERTIPSVGGRTLSTNRVAIELDGHQQIVYYWFQQRGRQVTNEYLVKWYIFWDALTRNRTDGALVRMVVPVMNAGDEADADARVARFAAKAIPALTSYVPD
jgi:EpsI family protein